MATSSIGIFFWLLAFFDLLSLAGMASIDKVIVAMEVETVVYSG